MNDDDPRDWGREPHVVDADDDLMELRSAVITSVEPMPGFRLQSLMVLSLWVPNAPEDDEPSRLHTTTWPAIAHDEMVRVARHVGAQADDD